MRVGVMVPHGNGEEMQGRFAAIRREGFSSCQLVSWDPALWTAENAQAVQALSLEVVSLKTAAGDYCLLGLQHERMASGFHHFEHYRILHHSERGEIVCLIVLFKQPECPEIHA